MLVLAIAPTVASAQTAGITVEKSPPAGTLAVGETVNYTFTVTNTGSEDLASVEVVDSITDPVTCEAQSLAPGASTTCSAPYVLTAADFESGTLVNTASAKGTYGVCTSEPLTASEVSTKAYTFPSGDTGWESTIAYKDAAGNILAVMYTRVKGEADRPLDTVLAGNKLDFEYRDRSGTTDPEYKPLEMELVTAAGAKIDPGTLTFYGKNTPNILDADYFNNSVGFQATIAGAATTVTLTQEDVANEVTLDPTFVATAPDAGDALTPNTLYYLSDPEIYADEAPGYTVVYAYDAMSAEESATFGFEKYATVLANEGNAWLAPVSGCLDQTTEVSGTDTQTTALWQPAISVVKTAPAGELVVGETINYTITVTNTGNVILDPVAIDDPLTADEACPSTSLAPGADMACTASYVITQADVDKGSIDNTATVTGTDPGGTSVEGSDSASFPLDQTPGLAVDKTGVPVDTNTNGDLEAGETIDYTITVTNTGTTTVSNLAVADSKTPAPTCDKTTLAPAEVATCTVSYTLTQADVDAGKVDNTATATATNPDGSTLTGDDSTSTPIPADPTLTVTKSAAPGELVVGDTINYSIVIANTGNVTLDPVVLDDPLTADESCPQMALAPAESMTCTSTYVITQADVDTGSIENTATATGTDPNGTAREGSDSATFPLDEAPGLAVVKTGASADVSAGESLKVGDTIDYTIMVTNTGNVTVSSIAIDDQLTADEACPKTELAPGESMDCTASYVVTQADVDKGSIDNTATVSGLDPQGAELAESGSATFPPEQTKGLGVTKVGVAVDADGNGMMDVGEAINYGINVTNTGTVTITDLVVADSLTGPPSCDKSTLAPGEVATCSAVYILTQADIDAGSVDNVATASGVDPSGNPVGGEGKTTTPVEAMPSIGLVKTAPAGDLAVGKALSYSFVVTNTGNVTLDSVALDDPLTADEACPKAILTPGEAMTCTASYTVTQGDVDAGSLKNTASVSGAGLGGGAVVDANDSVTYPLESIAKLVVDKMQPTGQVQLGQTLTYPIQVTNTGTVTVSKIVVTDSLAESVACRAASLAPGETTMCGAAYTVTAADVTAGQIVNTATAAGVDPDGGAVTGADTVTTMVMVMPPPPPVKPTLVPPVKPTLVPPVRPTAVTPPVVPPVTPTAVPPVTPKPPLAITGTNTRSATTLAVGLVSLGLVLVAATRRRKSH